MQYAIIVSNMALRCHLPVREWRNAFSDSFVDFASSFAF